MKLLPVVRMVAQHTDADCGVAAFAMLTGMSYEDILVLAGRQSHAPHRRGMYVSELVSLSVRVGLSVQYRRKGRVRLQRDTGILSVEHSGGTHFVVLRWGLIFDGGEVWQAEEYLRQYQAEVTSLLVVREDI